MWQEAMDLIKLAGFESPKERLACETIINSRDIKVVAETIDLLRKMILKKETAYQEYKQGFADLIKSQ